MGNARENSGAGEVSGRSPSASHDAVSTRMLWILSSAALGPPPAGEVQLPHLLGECAIEIYSTVFGGKVIFRLGFLA